MSKSRGALKCLCMFFLLSVFLQKKKCTLKSKPFFCATHHNFNILIHIKIHFNINFSHFLSRWETLVRFSCVIKCISRWQILGVVKFYYTNLDEVDSEWDEKKKKKIKRNKFLHSMLEQQKMYACICFGVHIYSPQGIWI